MNKNNPTINTMLIHKLIKAQFPMWEDLPIRQLIPGGLDNRTFRLGSDKLVRIPSAEHYAAQIQKEYYWLPKLASQLPLTIPTPLRMGEPGEGYPWRWSIYQWIEGETVADCTEINKTMLAVSLAKFLQALHKISLVGGPTPGSHNFYRGGNLNIYDSETRNAIKIIKNDIDQCLVTEIWDKALSTAWHGQPKWVHGDISAENLLIKDGKLNAVIDFGLIAVGDPACDLSITWTLFEEKNRALFKEMLALDDEIWARARAWTLWKALIIVAEISKTNTVETKRSRNIIHELIKEHTLVKNDHQKKHFK